MTSSESASLQDRPLSGTEDLPICLVKWAKSQGLESYRWQEVWKAVFLVGEDVWVVDDVRLQRIHLSGHPMAYYAGRVSETEKIYYWLDDFKLPDLGDWSLSH